MRTLLGTAGLDLGSGRRAPARRVGLLFCLAGLVLLPGCGGCRRTPPQTVTDAEKALAERRKKLRKELKKPNFELGFWRHRAEDAREPDGPLLAAQPHEARPQRCFVKPGHWTIATLPAKANHVSLVGKLETSVVDRRGDPMDLPGVPRTMTGERQAALPKGQPKRFDTVLYVPATGRPAQVRCRLIAQKGLRGLWERGEVITRMPAYQYHFVVLARMPELYGYVRNLDPVKMPTDLEFSEVERGYYLVWLLEPGRRVALPSHGLFWTSIAYLLWDDADPDRLTLDQQVALLDWLHWGGQLIVSGPDTLDALAGSFLAPYLPARPQGSRELTAADLDELNHNWTLGQKDTAGVPLAPVRPWAAVAWQKRPGARDVPGTGGLLVERRVGRGRVVVSAFRLSQREFTVWHSRHSFFNGCLLGRLPRKFFVSSRDADVRVTWAGGRLARRQLDPLLVTKVRYFSRDCGRPETTANPSPSETEYFADPYESQDFGPGAAGWSDSSAPAAAARDALTTAAAIEIPGRSFVFWVVGGYLLVLVPLNWAFFRVIGRVEWAWAAAPLIALGCTGVVIRMARLDIGFARSLTEVDVVELQGDYPRAHVTRYLAMYTSLATTYELASDDPGAQMEPFPEALGEAEGRDVPRFGRTDLRYRYGREAALGGFRVMSNSADMAHTEQMLDLGGPVSLVRRAAGPLQVVNRTGYTLRDVGVVRRNEQGALETTWLGTLAPGGAASLGFRPAVAPAAGETLWPAERDGRAETSRQAAKGQLNLRPLCALAEDPGDLERGDVRLVGWTDAALPGLEVRPAAPQGRRGAVVVAHLRYGFGPDPEKDTNTRSGVESE